MSVNAIKPFYVAILTFQTKSHFTTGDQRGTILKSNKCTDERVENCKEWAIENGADPPSFPDEYYDIVTVGQYSTFIW